MNEAVLRVLARLGLDAKPFKQEKVIELVKNPPFRSMGYRLFAP